jgi:signal transduction histidine kinase
VNKRNESQIVDEERRSDALAWQALLMAGALLLALVVVAAALEPPRDDLVLMGVLLAISGAASAVIGRAALHLSRSARWGGISLRIALVAGVGIGLALVNILFVAALMFLTRHDLTLLLALLLFSLAAALPLALEMGRSLASSIGELARGASRMADGDLQVRVPVRGRDELAGLARTFNTMAAGLEESMARQRDLERTRREVVAAVSHDLRTPLAAVRASVEALLDGIVTDATTVDRYLRTVRTEVERLTYLIDDLFELSQIDAGALHLNLEETYLPDLVSDTLEALQPHAQQNQVVLAGDVDERVPPVMADPRRLQRVLYNLVQNAVRHTPADGTVRLEARDTGAEITVTVADGCDGLAEEERQRVFEPFYRGDRSRQRHGDGAGLGLSIAKGIVEAHGGRIWVEPGHRVGCRFSFALPKTVHPVATRSPLVPAV